MIQTILELGQLAALVVMLLASLQCVLILGRIQSQLTQPPRATSGTTPDDEQPTCVVHLTDQHDREVMDRVRAEEAAE